MTTIIRIFLVVCVIVFTQLSIINFIHNQSQILEIAGNLPHRVLGGLFWCSQLQPEREDYAYDYIAAWIMADKREHMIEGQSRPVVPMLAVRQSKNFYFDPDMQRLRNLVMKEHYEGKSSFQYQQGDKK